MNKVALIAVVGLIILSGCSGETPKERVTRQSGEASYRQMNANRARARAEARRLTPEQLEPLAKTEQARWERALGDISWQTGGRSHAIESCPSSLRAFLKSGDPADLPEAFELADRDLSRGGWNSDEIRVYDADYILRSLVRPKDHEFKGNWVFVRVAQ